jgi:hypothetical protein
MSSADNRSLARCKAHLGPVHQPGFGPSAHTVWRRQVAEEVIDGVAACYQQMRDHDLQVRRIAVMAACAKRA